MPSSTNSKYTKMDEESELLPKHRGGLVSFIILSFTFICLADVLHIVLTVQYQSYLFILSQ